MAWVVAVVAAALAYRQAGAPLIVSILLAFSAVAVFCVRDGHRNGAGAVGVHPAL